MNNYYADKFKIDYGKVDIVAQLRIDHIFEIFQTIATGTGTDSLLVSATQQGEQVRYAGPLTKVGQLIGHGVYDATYKAIQKYNQHTKK